MTKSLNLFFKIETKDLKERWQAVEMIEERKRDDHKMIEKLIELWPSQRQFDSQREEMR